MTTAELQINPETNDRWQKVFWIVILISIVCWGWLRLHTAESAFAKTEQHHRTIATQVQRIVALNQLDLSPIQGTRPDVDLVARAQRALVAVGLPANVCQGVQPRSERRNGPNVPQRQSVEMILSGLTPGEFGSWIAVWDTPGQPWRIREVALNHLVIPAQMAQTPTLMQASSLDSNRYQVTLLLSAPAVSLEDAP